MSQEKRDWLDWLKRAKDGAVTRRLAAGKMGIGDRWSRSVLARMETRADSVVVHGLRGRESKWQMSKEIKVNVMAFLKSRGGHDFEPTFASQRLAKRHKIEASEETLRKWMMAKGI